MAQSSLCDDCAIFVEIIKYLVKWNLLIYSEIMQVMLAFY